MLSALGFRELESDVLVLIILDLQWMTEVELEDPTGERILTREWNSSDTSYRRHNSTRVTSPIWKLKTMTSIKLLTRSQTPSPLPKSTSPHSVAEWWDRKSLNRVLNPRRRVLRGYNIVPNRHIEMQPFWKKLNNTVGIFKERDIHIHTLGKSSKETHSLLGYFWILGWDIHFKPEGGRYLGDVHT